MEREPFRHRLRALIKEQQKDREARLREQWMNEMWERLKREGFGL